MYVCVYRVWVGKRILHCAVSAVVELSTDAGGIEEGRWIHKQDCSGVWGKVFKRSWECSWVRRTVISRYVGKPVKGSIDFIDLYHHVFYLLTVYLLLAQCLSDGRTFCKYFWVSGWIWNVTPEGPDQNDLRETTWKQKKTLVIEGWSGVNLSDPGVR